MSVILGRLARASVAAKRLSAGLAVCFLLATVLATDWPLPTLLGYSTDGFWRDHALLTGVVGSVLLLGAGLLAYDTEREIRRDRIRRSVENLMYQSLTVALSSLTKLLPVIRAELTTGRVGAGGQTAALRLARDALRELMEEFRHWQVVSLTLAHDAEPRSAELIGRQLILMNRAHEHLIQLAHARSRRQAVKSFSSLTSVLSDVGANHELLCWATQEYVNVGEVRRNLQKAVNLDDIAFVRAYGTFRTGLGCFPATGTPGIEPGLRFFDAEFDPWEFEWAELISARNDAANRLADGGLQINDQRLARGLRKPMGGGVLHEAVSRIEFY